MPMQRAEEQTGNHTAVLRLAVGVLALLLLPSITAAQEWEDYDYENLEFRGIGVDLSWVWPTRVESTAALGLRADLGYLGPNVRIVPGIMFWSSELSDEEVDRLADQIQEICLNQETSACPEFDFGEIRISDLVLNLDGHYVWDTDYGVLPYLGAGVGLHLVNGQGDVISGTFVEEFLDAAAPGINVLGGVGIPLGENLRLFTEARYALVSDVRFAALTLGAVWRFPSALGPVSPAPGS